MRYLVTTDPRAEAQEIEVPCRSAAVTEVLGTSHGDRDHVTVYVRPQHPQEWDVFSCVRHGASWSALYLGSVQVLHGETERLRTEREKVRAACVAACRRVESENGDPYDAMSTGRAEGADECADAIAALDLSALSENAPSR